MNQGIFRNLQRTSKDQYTLTFPKIFVGLLGWRSGDALDFGFNKNRLTVRKGSRGIFRKLQRTNKGQFILTVPKLLVLLSGWKVGQKIEFGFERNRVVLKGVKR